MKDSRFYDGIIRIRDSFGGALGMLLAIVVLSVAIAGLALAAISATI